MFDFQIGGCEGRGEDPGPTCFSFSPQGSLPSRIGLLGLELLFQLLAFLQYVQNPSSFFVFIVFPFRFSHSPGSCSLHRLMGSPSLHSFSVTQDPFPPLPSPCLFWVLPRLTPLALCLSAHPFLHSFFGLQYFFRQMICTRKY